MVCVCIINLNVKCNKNIISYESEYLIKYIYLLYICVQYTMKSDSDTHIHIYI